MSYAYRSVWLFQDLGFSRNNDNLGENIYKLLDEKIEKSPNETKMFLSEFIYKRRK